MSRLLFITLGLMLISCLAAVRGEEPAKELVGQPLLLKEDFESGEAEHWAPASPAAWKIDVQDKNRIYSQFMHQPIKTPFRSPFNRALVKDLLVSDCVLDVKLQSTIKDYGHRDMCLFFGYQDPAHFYYVHFGKQADDHANQIFIVNGADRKKISTQSTKGTNWDDAWHHARVVRNVKTGQIDVFFDDMDKPVMRAVDKTFTWGQVGIGTFDDTGNFDDVLIYGTKVEKPAK